MPRGWLQISAQGFNPGNPQKKPEFALKLQGAWLWVAVPGLNPCAGSSSPFGARPLGPGTSYLATIVLSLRDEKLPQVRAIDDF
jgi:hypothetical protein